MVVAYCGDARALETRYQKKLYMAVRYKMCPRVAPERRKPVRAWSHVFLFLLIAKEALQFAGRQRREEMQFKATEEQVKEMAVKATEASVPMGVGHFNFDASTEFKPEDFKISSQGLDLDYVQGRMVKLIVIKLGNDKWQLRGTPRLDYQSWAAKYPTNRELIESVGATVTKDNNDG